jgi:Ca2+-binding RTX toxin-like protein
MYGGADEDTMNGGGGDDYMAGGSGNDIMNGDQTAEVAPDDLQSTTPGDDEMEGGSGDDIMDGGDGDDQIDGGGGDDTITGGLGQEAGMWGGGGEDTFVWNDSAETGDTKGDADIVHDFDGKNQDDKIDLTAIDPGFDYIGKQQFSDNGDPEVRFKKGKMFIDEDGDGNTDAMVLFPGVKKLVDDDFV